MCREEVAAQNERCTKCTRLEQCNGLVVVGTMGPHSISALSEVSHTQLSIPQHTAAPSAQCAQCTVCRVAATVLTAGKMEWPQRELDCHLLLLLLLLLSAAYLLPLPTIYYLLDTSSCEEGKKVMDSVTCMMSAPEYIVGTCPKELVL